MNSTPLYSSTPVNEVEPQQLRPEIAPTSSPAVLDEGKDSSLLEKKSDIRRPTFSNASSVSVDQHYGLHIMLPSSASNATVPASITSLRHCVVDMSIPTTDGKPFASLTVKGVKESLIICGQVDGPAHITGVEHSAIVVSCRQFRMHNCIDVDVYLSCTSNPIIEGCSRIRFSKIPKNYVSYIFIILKL
jgi:tubulin-specific chaperone C